MTKYIVTVLLSIGMSWVIAFLLKLLGIYTCSWWIIAFLPEIIVVTFIATALCAIIIGFVGDVILGVDDDEPYDLYDDHGLPEMPESLSTTSDRNDE